MVIDKKSAWICRKCGYVGPRYDPFDEPESVAMNPKPTKYPFKFKKYDVVFYNDKTYIVEFTEYDWNVQGEVVTLKDAETGTTISGVDSRQVRRM